MQKAFEKIKEEVSEKRYCPRSFRATVCVVSFSDVIKIVNQVAEEYKAEMPNNVFDKITNFINSEIERTATWSEHDTQINILNYVQQLQEEYKSNDGWIPCSERLPEEDEKVYISTKTERVYVGVYTKRYGFEKREGFICDDGFMWLNTALAWKPYILPQSYQPKGE